MDSGPIAVDSCGIFTFLQECEGHQEVLNHYHYNMDEGVHVFSVTGPPLLDPDSDSTWTVHVRVPIGPIILEVHVIHFYCLHHMV